MSDDVPLPPIVEYKVPRLLWENFESIILAQSRRFIGELARRLDVPERELQRRVLPSADSLKILMIDSQVESLQCRAYVQNDSITSFCRKPISYPSEYCAFHQTRRMNVFFDAEPVRVDKLKTPSTKEQMWIRGSTIVNSRGETMGRIQKLTQTVKWFRVEESAT